MKPSSPQGHVPGRLWILTACVTIIGIQALVPGVLLVDIAADIGLAEAAVGAAFATYGLALAVSALGADTVLKTRTLRSRIIAGLLLLAAAHIVIAVAANPIVLVLGIIFSGIAAGTALPAVYAIVPLIVSKEISARATSRVLLGWAFSLVVGVPAFGLVTALASWRWVFVILASLGLGMTALMAALPATRPVASGRRSLRRTLSDRAVIRMLAGVAAFMAAFYGVFAFIGTYAREQLHGGPEIPSAIALAYGCGFIAAAGLKRWTLRYERVMLPTTFVLLMCIYGIFPVAVGSLPTALAGAAVWGLVNENALTALVARLSRVPNATTAFALYNTVTYVAAGIGTGIAGFLLSFGGFVAVGVFAAVVCALGLLAVTTRSGDVRTPPTLEETTGGPVSVHES